jgi:hypothetical protein
MSGEAEENHKNLNQDSRSTEWDLNPRPSEYEARMLITLRRSVAGGGILFSVFEVL